MSVIQPVRGTRDFYPEDMAFRTWLYDKIRAVSERYGYQEYDGPYLERLDLYAAKSGEELVKEQSYVFPDRSGTMIALRPELTPSLARMIAAKSKALSFPLRWWSFGPFWRYERTQKGRSREFFQWNLDLIGTDTPETDSEIVVIAAEFFRSLGISPEQVTIAVNNRKLVEKQLANAEFDPQSWTNVFRYIDRRDRMSESDWQDYGTELGYNTEQVESITQILMNRDAWKESSELIQFFDGVDRLDASDFVQYDPTVIRGLDYYTGTVYEAKDTTGEFRSILGGGRYDDLISDVGGETIPATGFAMGDMVLRLLLEYLSLYPELKRNPAEIFIPTFDDSTVSESLKLATELRSAGLRVDWYPEPVRLQRQFKYADREGIPLTVILGPEEIESGQVSIKDLRDGSQETVKRSQLVERIRSLL